MKQLRLYSIPIAYLLLYVVGILATGVWLFLLSQGLSSTDFVTTLKDIAFTPQAKYPNFPSQPLVHTDAL